MLWPVLVVAANSRRKTGTHFATFIYFFKLVGEMMTCLLPAPHESPTAVFNELVGDGCR